jgi:hypothetical protein
MLVILSVAGGLLFEQIASSNLPRWAMVSSVTLIILIIIFAGGAILSSRKR